MLRLLEVMAVYFALAAMAIYGVWRMFGRRGFVGLEDADSSIARLFKPIKTTAEAHSPEVAKGHVVHASTAPRKLHAAGNNILFFLKEAVRQPALVSFVVAAATAIFLFSRFPSSGAEAGNRGKPKELQNLVDTDEGKGPYYDKAVSVVSDLEALIMAGDTGNQSRIDNDKKALVGLLKEMDGRPTSDRDLAATAYGLLLYESLDDKHTTNARSVAKWGADNLPSTDYGFAIDVYRAHILAAKSPSDAISIYQKLASEPPAGTIPPFVTPGHFPRIEKDGTAFVQERLEDLRFLQDYASSQIWIYDTDGNLAARSAQWLKEQGLVQTILKGRWQGQETYSQPYVYLRKKPDHQIRENWRRVVAHMVGQIAPNMAQAKPAGVQYFDFASMRMSRTNFARTRT